MSVQGLLAPLRSRANLQQRQNPSLLLHFTLAAALLPCIAPPAPTNTHRP